MNSEAFAGYTDWRAPNVRELESTLALGRRLAVHPIFNRHCRAGCSLLDCSCFPRASSWTSTIFERQPGFVRTLDVRNGQSGFAWRVGNRLPLRAVRTDDRIQPLSPVLRTSQKSCWEEPQRLPVPEGYEPSEVACDGTGQDGQTRSGAPRSFVDHGDGTVTDEATGLIWEKLALDGSIHDARTRFSWLEAFTVKIAALNAASFAGHSDWRLPNVNEIASIRSFATYYPALYAAFHDRCEEGCSPVECSCSEVWDSWSSTSRLVRPSRAWTVQTWALGAFNVQDKSQRLSVRAVRSARLPNP
jgi:hypothetical protein